MRRSGGCFPASFVPSFAAAQSTGPVAQWSFNEGSGQVAHDSVSGTDDAIGGIFNG